MILPHWDMHRCQITSRNQLNTTYFLTIVAKKDLLRNSPQHDHILTSIRMPVRWNKSPRFYRIWHTLTIIVSRVPKIIMHPQPWTRLSLRGKSIKKFMINQYNTYSSSPKIPSNSFFNTLISKLASSLLRTSVLFSKCTIVSYCNGNLNSISNTVLITLLLRTLSLGSLPLEFYVYRLPVHRFSMCSITKNAIRASYTKKSNKEVSLLETPGIILLILFFLIFQPISHCNVYCVRLKTGVVVIPATQLLMIRIEIVVNVA